MKGMSHIVVTMLWVFVSVAAFAQEPTVENTEVSESTPEPTDSKELENSAEKEDAKVELKRPSLQPEQPAQSASTANSEDTKAASRPESLETASEQSAQPRRGFSLQAGTGFVSCIPNGEADCARNYPGPYLGTGLEYRFWYLGIALDFEYGWQIIEGGGFGEISSTNMHLAPILKGYYPMENFEIFGGFGMGYSSVSVTEEKSNSEASWSTFWKGMKFTAGVCIGLEPLGWPEGFSLDIAASFIHNSGGNRCTKYNGAGPCLAEVDLRGGQKDVAGQLKLGTAFRYTF